MHFKYCPHCGNKLIKKEIGDEGLIPFCESCETPLWDTFTTSIIVAVINENNEIALLKQSYVSETKNVLVAGIMKPGESAEEASIREIKEELGIETNSIEYIKSYPYEKKEMLMIGFRANVKKTEFHISKEVDSAMWVNLKAAPSMLREGGIAWQLVNQILKK